MAAKIPSVVVIGGSYVDIVIRCSQVPSAGQSMGGSALFFRVTGPGPLEAAQAALCGCDVHLVSKVGGDPFGRLVKDVLTEFKVKTDFVHTASAKNTGSVVTMVDAKGENASITYIGANSALLTQDIDAAGQIISQADVCLINGRLPQETVVAAVRCAKLHGTKVILNPARPTDEHRAECSQSAELPADYFSADILITNLCEAADITAQPAAGVRDAKLIGSDIVSRGAGSAVVTMGRRGCMVVDRAGADHIPAFEIELVDQTGRGSAFAGALAAYCAVDSNIRDAVKFASAAGALACMKFGSIDALPTRADIIELLQKEEKS